MGNDMFHHAVQVDELFQSKVSRIVFQISTDLCVMQKRFGFTFRKREIWESQGKKKIMKKRIERSWDPEMLPSDEEISHAKWLGDGCYFWVG